MIKKLKPSKFAAKDSQTKRLKERHLEKPIEVASCGLDIKVFNGVFNTSTDTELMAETVEINPDQTFLEIGCGVGVISIVVAKKVKSGVGTDINESAVENSKYNAKRHDIKNLEFIKSDLFENVSGKFDVIFCNPPYNNLPAKDDIDKMFWDTDNKMKKQFFQQVGQYLNDDGVIYFGWANFSDLDLDLPFRLAKDNNFEVVDVKSKASPHKTCTFYVLKLKKRFS